VHGHEKAPASVSQPGRAAADRAASQNPALQTGKPHKPPILFYRPLASPLDFRHIKLHFPLPAPRACRHVLPVLPVSAWRKEPPSGAQVAEWRSAAGQGNAIAQRNLESLYWKGEGVVKNEIEGYKWSLLAAAQGNELAKENVSIAETRLSPAQRAEGQRLAQEWKARHANRDATQ